MKKVFSVLMAGCVVGVMTIVPASASQHAAHIVSAAPSLAIVSGTVRDERGAPLSGAVVALLEPQPRGKELKSVKTDAQGRFSAGIAPGFYRLRAAAEGFAASFTRIRLDRPERLNYDFALKRTDTLVQRRGDSDDYRWIHRSASRPILNLQTDDTQATDTVASNTQPATSDLARNGFAPSRQSFHGIAQFIAAGSSGQAGLSGPNFFGTNFALAGSLGSNLEMAVIGQRGAGQMAPQRLAAFATMRPTDNHQVTASIGYGQIALSRKLEPTAELGSDLPLAHTNLANNPSAKLGDLPPGISQPSAPAIVNTLDQLSVSATASWQVMQPLLVIYGFDYSRFLGSARQRRDSLLPRFAVQYTPNAHLRLNAAITPGTDQLQAPENFNTENIQASFDRAAAEIAFADAPILDRSRRFETGFERLFDDGNASFEASAFYDFVSGHGVGVLALPLEASPENQVAFEQVAKHVAAMNGAARGLRFALNRRFNDHVTGSLGYSFGRGSRLNSAAANDLTPAQLFQDGFFQVATAKLDVDFTQQTGTRVSTVIRLSPSAIVFAIDPFAGRMSVYDPNINIYVTQELPNFGLPVRWEALVDVRNLLNQATGVDDGTIQLVTARSRRSVRGGLAFRW